MKRLVLTLCLLGGIIGSSWAQSDDLYFVPKKKKIAKEQVMEQPVVSDGQEVEVKTLPVTTTPVKLAEIDEDAYNRRGSYFTEQGDAVSEFAMSDEGFVLITEEGDTMWMNTDTLRLARARDDEGWVNGFNGSDSDYEYAMRIIRFRNPRYAIPVSSPLYWDVVYGGALWTSWDWNVYDDGMYAYVLPTWSNRYYWDYMTGPSYSFSFHWGYPYGYHWSSHYGWAYHSSMWYDPWCSPYYHSYHPGWHHGHYHGHHLGYHPGHGGGKPAGGHKVIQNHRTPGAVSSRRDSQSGATVSRTGSASGRPSSSRVVTSRESSSSSRNASSVSTSRSSRSTATSGSSRSSSSTSYSRPSSSRNASSSSVSRSSSSASSSRSSSSTSSSSSSRSSYSSGSSSRSSYSSGSSSRSSYSGGSSSRSSYSGGSSSRSSGSRR